LKVRLVLLKQLPTEADNQEFESTPNNDNTEVIAESDKVEKEKKILKCSSCPESYKREGFLKSHMEKKHNVDILCQKYG
jgi:hypothetical protein